MSTYLLQHVVIQFPKKLNTSSTSYRLIPTHTKTSPRTVVAENVQAIVLLTALSTWERQWGSGPFAKFLEPECSYIPQIA